MEKTDLETRLRKEYRKRLYNAFRDGFNLGRKHVLLRGDAYGSTVGVLDDHWRHWLSIGGPDRVELGEPLPKFRNRRFGESGGPGVEPVE